MSKRKKIKAVEKKTPKRKKKWHIHQKLSFGLKNYFTFAAGVLFIIVGFIFLNAGSMTLAPFLLVTGYCILIPLSVLFGIGKSKDLDEALKESGAHLD